MNANEPAFPSIDVEYQQGLPTTVYHHGLLKREIIAAMMLPVVFNANLEVVKQGSAPMSAIQVARDAVLYADALIAALSEEKK